MTPHHLVVAGLVVLLLFGDRLPGLTRWLYRGVSKSTKKVARFDGGRDDPPTASGVFAPIKPRRPSGTASES